MSQSNNNKPTLMDYICLDTFFPLQQFLMKSSNALLTHSTIVLEKTNQDASVRNESSTECYSQNIYMPSGLTPVACYSLLLHYPKRKWLPLTCKFSLYFFSFSRSTLPKFPSKICLRIWRPVKMTLFIFASIDLRNLSGTYSNAAFALSIISIRFFIGSSLKGKSVNNNFFDSTSSIY